MSKGFGLVQPSLIQQIKKILDQYPDDGQILKELIQNAEDAGAKEVKFLYDYHSYGIKKLHHPKLAKFQGPALYSSNDAKFTDKDWDGIGMLCDSIKEKDPTKVGRFGLGFKSVFHMTDLPSVISGNSVGIIDPEEKYFSDTDGKRSGRKWHLREDRRIMRKISDQFAPYKGIFGCNDESFKHRRYEGTLFRLPLRKEASQLSETIYSPKKMKGLFECFEKDAHLILLFLMNLERIEVYEREAHSSQPRKLFHVGISDHCLPDVRKAREEFSKKVQENASALSDGSFSEVKKTYHLTIETVHYNNDRKSKTEHSFVVTLLFSGSDVTPEIKALMTDESLSYLPLVGVALPLQPQIKQEDNREEGFDIDVTDDSDEHEYEVVKSSGSKIKRRIRNSGNKRKRMKTSPYEPHGHLFCFLPLPLENKSLTGLPVHVNGFFALSQNRRHLKWPSADQDETLTDKSLLWNKGLLQEVLPKAYAELILRVISCLSKKDPWQMTTSDAYNAWPDLNIVDEKWKGVLPPLFDVLLQSEVLHTDANGGGWCKAEDVILDDMKRSDKSRKIVIDLLAKTGENVVTAPAHIKRALEEYCTFDLKYVTPKILRTCLKSHPSCYTHLSHEDKILLLRFVLKDSNVKDLEGLQLLPLSDKTFTTFGGRSDYPIYIDSAEHPKSLLPGLQGMFLDTESDDAVTEQLRKTVEEDHTQLRHFNKEAVKRHLRQTLPPSWLGSEDHITWHPGKSNQPTIKWLKELWEYFRRHFAPNRPASTDLDALVGLPLVPLSPLTKGAKVELARIQRPSSLVLASFRGESIDESVCRLLKSLGLTILKDLPDYIQYYPVLVPTLANPPSSKGVLNALYVFTHNPKNKEKPTEKLKNLRTSDIRDFRKFLSNISQVDLNMKDLLRKLPLFETWVGCSENASRFVSLDEVKNAAPNVEEIPSVNAFIDLIDLRKPHSSQLARLLGTFPMSQKDLLEIILDNALNEKYSGEDLDKIVQFIFQRFGVLNEEDAAGLREKLKRLPFVPWDKKTARKRPGELFDPKDKILSKVFLDEQVFPEGQYYAEQDDVLIHLRKLGLKGRDGVTASDILKCAKLVNHTKNVDKAKVKSTAILKLLEQFPSLLEAKVKHVLLKNCLDDIPFIPVLMKRPETYPIDFPLKETGYSCPKTVTSHEFINLVGSVKLLVNTETFLRVSARFGWNKRPCLEDVKIHLENAIKVFQKSKNIADLKTKNAFEKIYGYFQDRLKYDQDEVKELLTPLKFILVEKHLLSTNQVAFSSQVSYPPYLCQLPDDYRQRFRKLFDALDVRESFGVKHYIKTLSKIEQKYGKRPIAEEFKRVSEISNLLADAMGKEKLTAVEAVKKYGTIFLPDSKRMMRPSKDVCVKDCFWMPDEEGVVYANENISPKVCITLGAKTRRQETLRKHTLGIPFGQKEKLTNRLKRILTGYPCDESILKEILQNADDAKATKVCFIKDPCKHRDTRVFEECWKPLQGPALCVYNNAPFTTSDIEGIQNLGEGNKGDDPNKTGQYGVGFNAVYHLTDAPTFISQGKEIGEVMCVFDPNLKFAPGADESNPGVMYKDLPALRKTFPDVFLCYDLGRIFRLKNATIFRFPLRNKDMANTSKISNKAMTIKKLDHLLSDFKEELLQVLLFVNNINEIAICEIDKKTRKLYESYFVQSSLSLDDEEKRKDFAARVSKIGKRLQNGEMSVADIPVHQVSYVVNLKDSKGLNQKWFVVQKIGFEHKENVPDNVKEAFRKGDLGLLPRGGVASLISSSKEYQDTQGKAFCFLPLPFKTGLPVHVNGHFALDHEARRNLWRDDKGDYRSNWNDALLRQVVAPCYVTLLDEVRQHISLSRDPDGKTCIKGTKGTGEDVLSRYVDLFPPVNVKAHENYWEVLCKEVYRHINARDLRLLPVLRQENCKRKTSKANVVMVEWLPPTGKGCDQAFFDNFEEVLQDDTEYVGSKRKAREMQKEEVLRDSLLSAGFNLLHMPMKVYKCFKNSNVDVSLVSPTDVISFFRTYNTTCPNQLCNIGTLPSNIKDTQFKTTSNLLTVLKYCKQDKTFVQKLEGLPLLLTEDDVLRVFSQSHKVFLSRYYELLPRCKSMFVHHILHPGFHFDEEAEHLPSLVFKRFDIASFASQLPKEMATSWHPAEDGNVAWYPEDEKSQIPNKRWINRTWKFFSVHIEKKIKDFEKPQWTQGGRQAKNQIQEKKRLAQEVLEPVKDWCLLPAFLPPPYSRHVLVPLKLAQTVIYLEGSMSSTLESLRKISLPELNCEVFEEDSSSITAARGIVADLTDPESVLSALLHKLKTDSRRFQKLQDCDCSKVLSYFSSQVMDPKCVESLRKLPLYVTIHDDIISISEKKAFVLSSRIPKDGMEKWEETAGIVFLKENKTLEDLYEFIQCHSKANVDVYCDVIFEKFEELSEKARLEHLMFVKNLLNELESENDRYPKFNVNVKTKQQLQKLLDALQKLKFMTAQDGTLRTASSFYDPSNEVFAAMFKNNQKLFPPKPFWNDTWLPFLRQIGLIRRVSNVQFLQFCKEVEKEAHTNVLVDETRKKSKALATYLFESENTTSRTLLDDVKDICFIFPYVVDPHLQAIHEQYGSGKTGSPCICFCGSVASKNHSITWTTANLLPDSANPLHCDKENLTNQKQKEVARRLGILQDPSVDMVVNHCKNVCNLLCKDAARKESKKVLQKVVGIMTSIYKYLDKNYIGNKEVINELKNIRCIVVDNGKRFVLPYQVAVDITSDQEIPPYLYKIPLEVGNFAELFRNLGTTNTITAAQYSMVLKNIHDETEDKKLHPNETTNAFKATKGFFERFDGNTVQDTEVTPLYLPGVKQNPSDHSVNMVFLRVSTNIVCNDAPHLKDRIRHFNNLILVKLADCGLEVNNEDLLVKKLPEAIRPRMLTSVVHETLIEGEQRSQVSCSSTAQELRQVLTSCEFCHGMIRLIKHADYESEVETNTDTPANVQVKLRSIRVYSVPNLRTKLVYNGTAIFRSEANVSCFEETTEEENEKVWKIYIEKDAELSKYVSVVAKIIDRITGHLLKTMLVHLPMLLSSKPYEIKGLLDGLKIREDNSVLKNEATCLPTPGNFIHITDHHLLVDDFTVFSRGEYVGYELDDPSLRGEDGTATYIYAIVIEEVFENGQPSNTEPSLRKYRIDIGKDKEPVVVDAADLYKFYRPSKDNSECMELEPFAGSRDEKPANLDEIRKEIGRILQEAWRQPEEKRKKIIKRLFLKWHPDKNPRNETLCTEVFKFIQQEIRRLEKGEGLTKKSRTSSGASAKPRKGPDHSRSYSSFFKSWSSRAHDHKKQSSSFYHDGGFSTFSWDSNRCNPQPGEAKRWYSQAKADLKAASNDVDCKRTSYEWACFKCHQSAEKALKAAQYSIDADKTNVHNLRMIAHDLSNDNLSRLASELERLVGDSTRMRYPDRLCYPDIPHSVYTSTMASKAIDLASDIVKEVKSKFIN